MKDTCNNPHCNTNDPDTIFFCGLCIYKLLGSCRSAEEVLELYSMNMDFLEYVKECDDLVIDLYQKELLIVEIDRCKKQWFNAVNKKLEKLNEKE
jgi:hypothetical protein